MSFTALLFLLFYFLGLILALTRNPKFGLYTYLFEFYLHPATHWWGSQVPDWRWSLIAALVTLLALVMRTESSERAPWYRTNTGIFFLLYSSWMVLQFFWSVTGQLHTEGVLLYGKYLVLFIIIYQIVNSEIEIRNFLLVHILGCAYLGWLAYGTNVSGRLEGMGGPGIADANTFGMHMTTAVVWAAALMMQKNKYIRLLLVIITPFILNAIVLTQSRGAFVGLLMAGFIMVLTKPPIKKLLFYGLGALGMVLLLILSPPNFIKRMDTITAAVDDTKEIDDSAEIRIKLAGVQWKIAKRHPFGTGHRGTRILSNRYLDPHDLTRDRLGNLRRSSHSTILAVLVDQGFPGFLLYLWIIFGSGWRLWKSGLHDKLRNHYNLAVYRMGLAAMLGSIVFAGLFANYFKAEVFIWALALISCFAAEIRKIESSPALLPDATPHHPARWQQAE